MKCSKNLRLKVPLLGYSLFRCLPLCAAMVAVNACGGGGGGGNDKISACSTLKVAGGEQCETPPRSVAVVASDVGYCTGTFITTRHVLTAAHCFPNGLKQVVIGSRGFSANSTKVTIHPKYDGAIDSPFDIAVVTVGTDAPVSPVPIKLSQSTQVGDVVVTYGYGIDQNGEDIVERVQDGGLPLKATPLDIVAVDSGTVMSQSDGTGDTCQGDSGGPLLLTGSNGEPGIIALVRAGPPGCVPDSGLASDNTNVQASAATDFIFGVAPAARAN